jgi:general secretion pathway protein L
MPMMKNVLGLDIGSHTMKAVELRQTFRGLEPVQLRVHPRADVDAPIAESLHRFVRMHQLTTENVACALPSDRVTTRRLEFPFRDRKRLDQAVPFEVEGEIPFDLDEVIIDWQLIGGDRSHGVVAATVAQRGDVSDYLEGVTEAGCPPRVLEAEGLVLGNLTALFDLKGTRLLIDLGHRKTTFCLLIDEQPVASRTVPVGGLALTRAIAKDRGISLEQAEQIKCEQGIFDTGFNSLSEGAIRILDRIARETLRSLESHEHILGGSAAAMVDEITLVGGGARLHRIDEYLASRTGIATALLALPEEPEGAALVAGGDPVLFGPAIALALRSTAKAVTSMNFRQDEFAYRTDLSQLFTREQRPTLVMAAIALVLFGSSTATSIALESRKADKLEAQAVALYTDLFPDRAPPDRPVAALSQAVSEARERADFLGLYGGNLSALDLMTIVSQRIPAELNVKFDEVNIDRKVIRIKVAAENYEAADRLEAELKKEPVFAGADVSGGIKRLKDGSVTFNLSVPLEAPRDS